MFNFRVKLIVIGFVLGLGFFQPGHALAASDPSAPAGPFEHEVSSSAVQEVGISAPDRSYTWNPTRGWYYLTITNYSASAVDIQVNFTARSSSIEVRVGGLGYCDYSNPEVQDYRAVCSLHLEGHSAWDIPVVVGLVSEHAVVDQCLTISCVQTVVVSWIQPLGGSIMLPLVAVYN